VAIAKRQSYLDGVMRVHISRLAGVPDPETAASPDQDASDRCGFHSFRVPLRWTTGKGGKSESVESSDRDMPIRQPALF
jgi:hypothetical protein